MPQSTHILRRWIFFLLGLCIWALLYTVTFEATDAMLPWLAIKGFLAFLLPGVLTSQAIYADEGISFHRDIARGFLLSIGVLSSLGLIGLITQLPAALVHHTFAFIALCLLGYTTLIRDVYADTKLNISVSYFDLAVTLFLIVSFYIFHLLMGDFTYDSQAYNALTYEYATADQLGFTDMILHTDNLPVSRLWLALWPLSLATMIFYSGAPLLEVYVYLLPFTFLMVMVSVFHLARVLGFSRRIAYMAVIFQVTAMFFYNSGFASEMPILSLLVEDKRIAGFIIFNILFSFLISYQDKRTRLNYALYAISVVTSLAVHPTVTVLSGCVVGIYGILKIIWQREYRFFIALLLPFVFISSILLGLRLADTDAYMTFAEVDEDTFLYEQRSTALTKIEGTPFAGVPLNSIGSRFPYWFLVASALIAIWRIRKQQYTSTSLLLIAAFALLVFVVVPFTGWLLGMAITPWHLGRFRLVMPFGLATAYLVVWLMPFLGEQYRGRFLPYAVSAGCILLFLFLRVLPVQDQLLEKSAKLIRGQDIHVKLHSDSLIEVLDVIDEQISEDVTVVTHPIWLMNYIPSASEKAVPYFFRQVTTFNRQSGIPYEEAQRRGEISIHLFSEEITSPEFEQLLRSTDIDYLIVPVFWWVNQGYREAYSPFLVEITTGDRLVLLELQRGEN